MESKRSDGFLLGGECLPLVSPSAGLARLGRPFSSVLGQKKSGGRRLLAALLPLMVQTSGVSKPPFGCTKTACVNNGINYQPPSTGERRICSINSRASSEKAHLIWTLDDGFRCTDPLKKSPLHEWKSLGWKLKKMVKTQRQIRKKTSQDDTGEAYHKTSACSILAPILIVWFPLLDLIAAMDSPLNLMAELGDRIHKLFGESESEGGMSDNDSDESSDVEYLAFKKIWGTRCPRCELRFVFSGMFFFSNSW